MNKTNELLMHEAKVALQGNWGLAIGTIVIYFLITIGINFIPVAGSIAAILIGGPFALGIAIFFLGLSRNQNMHTNQLFDGFKNFGNAIGAYLLMLAFILLWLLLLIIPGIIAALSYAMTFYIMADDPTIGSMDALNKSKQMMDGYKLKLFYLHLRFLAWGLLCILTLGIGFLWLMPWVQVTVAKFYDDIKNDSVAPVEL